MKPKILILGAGYGGLTAALKFQRELYTEEAEIILINKHDYHYMTTHLHQSAAGTVDTERVKINLNELIDQEKITCIKAEVIGIDIKNDQRVFLSNGNSLTYDILIIALGSEVETFGIEGLKEHAFTIRSINSVQLIKKHIEYMFAKYKAEAEKSEYLTFVVGGAGFTGIEFLGELTDRIPILCKQFHVQPDKVKLINIEAAPNPLPGFDPQLVEYAVALLKKKGVKFITNTPIKACMEHGVLLENGNTIKSKTVIWTGGVRGNSVVGTMGIEHIRNRVKVDSYLRVPSFNNVFLIGDLSIILKANGVPYPPTAQMAVQQGEYVSEQIISFIRNGEMPFKPFTFSQKGILASLGKGEAVGEIGDWKLVGYPASFIKQMIDNRYLYSIGGFPLLLKKGKIIG